ncbi:DNA methyltransferase [Bacillus massilinigeriensis]|uniref:DNA methyltransferase n=1 Tax=Bacillus massilionigeriensis TaxID=1805475 RepID=UPI00096B24F6|nr:DNA methyltransferase [Bacillus massilionigeriensis]
MKDQEQLSFQSEYTQKSSGPVICLGMTFTTEEERREYFRQELRNKLPELKSFEGFPIGEDEDIIALSDPPYYTACPNPWINEFIQEWEREKVDRDEGDGQGDYHREPFVGDVSEGKNDPIYNVHTYHTKVPYKAIMRYILHYTNPGDIVFDGFSGTGMTGVAGYMCNDDKSIQSLQFRIDDNHVISPIDKEKSFYHEMHKGKRNVIMNDLSTAATFISYNYNTPVDIEKYQQITKDVFNNVKNEFGFLFQTISVEDEKVERALTDELQPISSLSQLKEFFERNSEFMSEINYVVHSDVFVCPECTNEVIYYDSAVDYAQKTVLKDFDCPSCGVKIQKRKAEKAWATRFDPYLNQTVNQAKQVPVKINYSCNGKRYDKRPGIFDMKLLDVINNLVSEYKVPTNPLPEGYNTRQPMESHGLTNVHHFYTNRNLLITSAFWHRLPNKMKWLVTSFLSRNLTKMNRFVINKHNPNGRINGPLSGTLYIPSLVVEQSAFQLYLDKILNVGWGTEGNIVQTGSTTQLNIQSNSIDYIFLDPPFGANIMYSEVNFIWESWLNVLTNNKNEAIQNSIQEKGITEYRNLMSQCFKEAYRILKPGKWMTVEFSNTQASVWNAIQTALQEAKFVVANVSVLDKKHGGIKAMTNPTSVKQDLVISAYKPTEIITISEKIIENPEEFLWSFIENHLDFLPVFIGRNGEGAFIAERDPRILYDRTIAYFVTNGINIPLSSGEFQAKIIQKYPIRDGMVFLNKQVAEYDKKRTLVKEFVQMNLFVSDETSAIEWIRQQLIKKPQTRQDIQPLFMKEIQHIAKHEMLPELDDLLQQNFLIYDGEEPVPNQIMTYLKRTYKDIRGLESNHPSLIEKAINRWYVPDPNKQADLEKLRERSLLREFDGYLEELENNKKDLKQFRTEAIRAGFKKAWSNKEFDKIVKLGERLPEAVIQEDEKLLMYYDNAQIRLGF